MASQTLSVTLLVALDKLLVARPKDSETPSAEPPKDLETLSLVPDKDWDRRQTAWAIARRILWQALEERGSSIVTMDDGSF